eukprot:SAG22_NODE_10711_length_520_cov_0.762470_1_plen_92_part_10
MLVWFWLLFSYFELIPDRDVEEKAWLHRDFSSVRPPSGLVLLMLLLIVVEMGLLPVASWMSLITYEAHMADPVELLSILLIEEQRITRKGGG